uniref:Uncharacterized protein n=1 Tax=Brassica oleracea TaxID=3712 RepID=A0A3P6FKZ0_BRAOL|nr:unnamed protein product [Brassica oleracea]
MKNFFELEKSIGGIGCAVLLNTQMLERKQVIDMFAGTKILVVQEGKE